MILTHLVMFSFFEGASEVAAEVPQGPWGFGIEILPLYNLSVGLHPFYDTEVKLND